MTPGELQNLFANLKVWHGQGWRAPNKPLLALWAIGRCLRNEVRLAPYDEIARELGSLLRRFGPPRKRVNPDVGDGLKVRLFAVVVRLVGARQTG